MNIPRAQDAKILAGNLGGTNCRLLLRQHGSPDICETFPTAQFGSLKAGVTHFLQGKGSPKPDFACVGVAGPVRKGQSSGPEQAGLPEEYCEGMNLPWQDKVVRSSLLAAALQCPVRLLNDAVAEAWGLPVMEGGNDLVLVNHGDPNAQGNQCLMTVGTGCGQCAVPWIEDLGRHEPFGTEGSHQDWGPSPMKKRGFQRRLYRFLTKQYGGHHISSERTSCGQGLVDIFDCLVEAFKPQLPQWLTARLQQEDPASVIAEAALSAEPLRQSSVCKRALGEFVWCLGAAAGNLALAVGAWGGVFVGGGIPPRILPRLLVQDSDPDALTFMNGFLAKGRHAGLMKSIPVRVVLNANLGVLGAARYASLQLEKGVKTRLF